MNKLKYIVGAMLIIYIVTLLLQIDNIDRSNREHINNVRYTYYQ